MKTSAQERNAQKRNEQNQAQDKLTAMGIQFLYAGHKGHGFWIRRNGATITNGGENSGNPNFWLCSDILAESFSD